MRLILIAAVALLLPSCKDSRLEFSPLRIEHKSNAPRVKMVPRSPPPERVSHTDRAPDACFDAEVVKKTEEWFDVRSRKGNIYRLRPAKNLRTRTATNDGWIPNYSQVKEGQTLRLWLRYETPVVSEEAGLLGIKAVPVVWCDGITAWVLCSTEEYLWGRMSISTIECARCDSSRRRGSMVCLVRRAV
jgi:hypothetical protein